MKKIEITLLISVILTIMISSVGVFAKDCGEIRENVLRIHVLANSDSEEDQALKLKVRDAVLKQCGSYFDGMATRDEAKAAAQEHLGEIEETANQTIAQEGYGYTAKAEVVNMFFETREYEQFTMPAGKYDAVRVTIGEAQGKNWWCVMFPPMCLPAAQENTEEACQDVFTDEQLEIIEEKPKYEIRFAVVEWIEKIKDALFS